MPTPNHAMEGCKCRGISFRFPVKSTLLDVFMRFFWPHGIPGSLHHVQSCGFLSIKRVKNHFVQPVWVASEGPARATPEQGSLGDCHMARERPWDEASRTAF